MLRISGAEIVWGQLMWCDPGPSTSSASRLCSFLWHAQCWTDRRREEPRAQTGGRTCVCCLDTLHNYVYAASWVWNRLHLYGGPDKQNIIFLPTASRLPITLTARISVRPDDSSTVFVCLPWRSYVYALHAFHPPVPRVRGQGEVSER